MENYLSEDIRDICLHTYTKKLFAIERDEKEKRKNKEHTEFQASR